MTTTKTKTIAGTVRAMLGGKESSSPTQGSGTLPASSDAQRHLEQAQAKLDSIELARAELEAQIAAKRTETTTAVTPDALHAAELELASLELKLRAMRNALRVAALEREGARGATAHEEYAEAAKAAVSAQQQIKVSADAFARALQTLLRAQAELVGMAKDFDEARKRAQALAAATGQPMPKLHSASGAGLARAHVRDAQWAVGLRGGCVNVEWTSPRETLSDVVHSIRKDLHMQVLHEINESLSEAEQLRALLDDSYREHQSRVYAERQARSEGSARDHEERAEREARERKAARQGSSGGAAGGLLA